MILLATGFRVKFKSLVSDGVLQEPVLPYEFRFIVEFKYDDGTLIMLGPCCGATETDMPPKSQFPYTVVRVGD